MYNFTDAEFLSATEKQTVIKAWVRFLKSGLARKAFTKALYNHLHLHCGFIAHYDINGFYATYFNGDMSDKVRFFTNIEQSNCMSDYQDLNDAMLAEYAKYKTQIMTEAEEERDSRFELLKEIVKRAETDVEFRSTALNRLFN